ncbi:MAG: ISKra4 family transposase [Candidatus Electrothrix sp. AUS1_2]|nr:ISKra4 family transposase [Candidatus Electrothrix sp. AUS1_2]
MTVMELQERMRLKIGLSRKSAGWGTKRLPNGLRVESENPGRSFRRTVMLPAAVKKIHRHSTFGVITVFGQEYRQQGKRLRPFSRSAGITCRCCSLPLQRAVTDFGADHSFGRVPGKLKEHYGITLPVSTVRNITATHARHVHEKRLQERIEDCPSVRGRDCVIAETDGGMVPIVVTDKNAEDRRKGKKHNRKEARLSIARVPGDTTLNFGVEFQENVDEAGKVLFDCACRAGFGRGTYLHSAGDGTSRIFGQAEKRFGPQGHYLVDFYHLYEYPEDAAPACSGKNKKGSWADRQKEFLKSGHAEKVTEALRPHLEPETTEDRNAPVRRLLRYLHNRPGQFDYPGARARGFPVGSGEIESAHRYIIQERLKIAGAWWTPENARFMLALRVDRADGYWEKYWDNMRRAA